MSKEAFDEMSVLSAIYCEKGEFELLEESPERGIVYRIHTLTERDNEKTPLGLIFHISPNYPHTPPDISISSCHLSRKECHDLRQQLLDTARSLPPEPMIHGLMLWLQENFSDLIKTSSCHSAEEYTHRQKTVKVDVDSSGKRCKEKMMSVLCEIPQLEETRMLSTFEVKDVLSLDDLKSEFDLVGLTELYDQFVPSLI
ncbi:hypothetical protein R3I94_005349 [Phoxinus phoxinus]|uniref:RWD domain-containing protein 3 n=1 Tax=Phoxinus phoxinus TaxID=58324 RepID=A0AAN9HAB9_9TELE